MQSGVAAGPALAASAARIGMVLAFLCGAMAKGWCAMDKKQMLARMDPQLRGCYERITPYSLDYETLCAIRAYTLAQIRQGEPACAGRGDIRFQVVAPAGAELRIYDPVNRTGAIPVLLHAHGGGGVMSSAEQDDPICLALALQERCVVPV